MRARERERERVSLIPQLEREPRSLARNCSHEVRDEPQQPKHLRQLRRSHFSQHVACFLLLGVVQLFCHHIATSLFETY